MQLAPTLFATSFTLVVAAGLVQLDAGPEADGPARKPVLGVAVVHGHKLAVSLDRDRVPAGQEVTLSILAKEGGAGDTVRVAVLEQSGSPMMRSMPPPREVFHQDVTIAADGAVKVPIKLAGLARPKGAEVDPLAVAGSAVQYTVQVLPTGGPGEHDTAAYLPIFAYEPEAYRLEIEPIAAGAAGTPVDIAVRVTSLADKPLRGVTIGGSGELASVDEPARLEELAPGAQAVVHLKGTRGAPAGDTAMVQVYGFAEYGGTAAAWAKVDRAGTLVARASEASDPAMMGGLF